MKDYQARRVYQWEKEHLAPGPMVDFPQAQSMVEYIWSDYGLKYPPSVIPIAPQTKKWAGKANRLEIQLQKRVSTKTIVHEVAHSMMSNMYGESAMHGPLWVGMYAKLLQKYMHVDLFKILQTCAVSGVKIDINASPLFVD